jgi:xanthine dehydrogenase large subunit
MDAAPKSKKFIGAGNSTTHDSAARHVAGTATYIDDIREPEGTVHLAPGFAPKATRGRIAKCDLQAVRNYPGIITVLTAADIPGVNDCSPGAGDDPVLAQTHITFHGQPIFCVVAETREAARRAARFAVIEIEAEKPTVTVEDALAANTDVLPSYQFKRGDAAQTIASSPHQITDSFRIGGQEHFYLEGQIALAIPRENGEMLIHSSTQHPSEVQHVVAHMLGVSDAAITCECRRMGGAFGGKESQAAQWAALAALATHKTGRAAKLRLDRDDDMMMTGKRHDFRVDWQAGFDASGRINAVDTQLLSRCGVSADLSQGVNDRTMFHSDNSYFYPELSIFSRRLHTNTVSNTAFRGFGGPQGIVFAERMMEAIAIQTGLDPLDVRKRNYYTKARDITPYGQKVVDNILPELTAELERTSDYRKRVKAIKTFNDQSPILKKGIALTPVKFGISFTLASLNQAGALVHVYTDGSVQVNHGGTEMGQGLYTKVAQIVASEFGIPLDDVRITATTTDKVPNTSPTAASAGADLNGMAASRAAITIRDRMAEHAAKLWDVLPKQIRFEEGQVKAARKSMSFAALAKSAQLARIQLSATGFYATPDIHWDRAKAHGSPFFYFAYGAACSEVTIDTLTGEMTVDRVDILHDVGKSLNPAIDLGQIEGGFVQGMGWLTTEELVYDAEGKLRTHAPSTYKIPCASDVPSDFRTKLWKSDGNKVPTVFRSKAVGEPPVMLAISVYCAILRAIGSLNAAKLPPLDAPATPEMILRACRAMEG